MKVEKISHFCFFHYKKSKKVNLSENKQENRKHQIEFRKTIDKMIVFWYHFKCLII